VIADRRQRVIVILLQKLSAFVDPTPVPPLSGVCVASSILTLMCCCVVGQRTFLRNVLKMYSLGVLDNINFLQQYWTPNTVLQLPPTAMLSSVALAASSTSPTSAQRQQRLNHLLPAPTPAPTATASSALFPLRPPSASSSPTPSTSASIKPKKAANDSKTPLSSSTAADSRRSSTSPSSSSSSTATTAPRAIAARKPSAAHSGAKVSEHTPSPPSSSLPVLGRTPSDATSQSSGASPPSVPLSSLPTVPHAFDPFQESMAERDMFGELSRMQSRYRTDFTELGLLGKGGFGAVYKVTAAMRVTELAVSAHSVFACSPLMMQARHNTDGMCYAVKQISVANVGFASLMQRKVLREVTCLAKLDHPNVCRYYNAWIEPVWEDAHTAAARAGGGGGESSDGLGDSMSADNSGDERGAAHRKRVRRKKSGAAAAAVTHFDNDGQLVLAPFAEPLPHFRGGGGGLKLGLETSASGLSGPGAAMLDDGL
jgi:hypothetical protein